MNSIKAHAGTERSDRAIEWLCAFVMVWWAIALSLPGEIFAAPLFAGFASVGLSQRTWVLLFSLSGGARVVALAVNGRWPRTPLIRMACAGFGCFIFSQLAWLFYEGALIVHGPFQTGVGVYALLAVGDLLSIYRAAHDARYYHR